jgi:hypothetical protein
MKLINGLFILITGLVFTSCSKVIDVKLPTAAPKLVIEASIDWYKNTPGNEQRIILSTSTGYYNEAFPSVSGAQIRITNSQQTTFTFSETSKKGEYLCTNFVPEVGNTYQLTVVLNDVTYIATETFMATPDIESVTHTAKGGMTGDEYEVQFSWQDDGSQDNYYMSRTKINRIAFPDLDVESDENYQGRKMTEFFSHEDLVEGDSINIKIYGVSRRFHDYFKKVIAASGNDGSPFPAVPTAARGNIVNQKNADDYPFGYFRLSQVATRDYKIQ